MPRYAATIATSKPVDEVFHYMADFRSVERWDETAVKAELLDGTVPGPEARFRVAVKLFGKVSDLDYETVAYEPPRRFVLRAETPSIISEDEVCVRETGTGSELTYDASLSPKGVMKLASPILGIVFKRLGDNAAKGLARELGGKIVA